MAPVKDLYDRDFAEWTARNAELLRAGRLDEADIEHIAEEIEDMGKRQRHELRSRLRVLLTHLLKWQAQRDRRGPSWIGTIATQRAEIGDLLEDAPSLRGLLCEGLGKVYGQACSQAARETGLALTTFAEVCPFSLDQILDQDFFPE
jgi:hypothetical protein